MSMRRWDPFGELQSMRNAMDRMFEDFVERPMSSRTGERMRMLPVDMFDTDEGIVVKATVAGMRPEDINISVNGNMLTIQGERQEESEAKEGQSIRRERWHGSFRRDITLPTTVSAERAEATFEHGVLTLRLPKSEEARPRRIPVRGTVEGDQRSRGQIGEPTGQKQPPGRESSRTEDTGGRTA